MTFFKSQKHEAVQTMRKLVGLDSALKQQLDTLEGTVPELEGIARDIRPYADQMECDPKRLEEIESRFGLIRNLKARPSGITDSLI